MKSNRKRKYNLPTGVYLANGHYNAVVRHNTKRYYLGCFPTPEEAEKQVALFRKEHPKTTGAAWKPGDKL